MLAQIIVNSSKCAQLEVKLKQNYLIKQKCFTFEFEWTAILTICRQTNMKIQTHRQAMCLPILGEY